jgi:tetratricopeptide (TPR) repeat protein
VPAPPTPTPTETPTDLTGITPDARLPRDRADASDVLVEDALELISAGRLAVARVALDHAVELDRINPQAYEAYARYDIAARNFPHAIEMAERAVGLRRQSRYYLVLGDAYLAAGDKAHAREAWERGVAIDRDRTCRARLEANP